MIARGLNRGMERKSFFAGASITAGTTYVISSVSDIPQGQTDVTRIGDSLQVKNLHLQFIVAPAVAAALVGYVRVCVFQFTQQFSVNPPTGANTRQADPIGGVTHLSPWIVDGRAAIRPLYDQMFVLPDNGVAGQYPIYINQRINLSSAKKTITYNNASTTDAWDKIYIGAVSNLAANFPTVRWLTQLDYTDA